MSSTEKITLVTGANKGIGLATARQLAGLGHTVLLGSRDTERGARAAEKLAEVGMPVWPVTIDVTAADLRPEFETNVFGLVRVIHAMLPLLRKSSSARIVNVASDSAVFAKTSEAGSMFARSHESFVYSATKAAVKMLTLKYANAFLDDPALAHIQVNSVTPGYTATDLNGFKGSRTVDEGRMPW